MTSLRSFLLYYLPLLEPRSNMEEDDDDFVQDAQEEHRVDLVVPFKKSVKQIFRETTNVTTRRILERLAFHYISQRMAWKLLKDVPKSAARKAQRGMLTVVFIWSVSKTTFTGYLLGVLASWFVQVSIETYRCLSCVFHRKEEDEGVDPVEEFVLLAKKVGGCDDQVYCFPSVRFNWGWDWRSSYTPFAWTMDQVCYRRSGRPCCCVVLLPEVPSYGHLNHRSIGLRSFYSYLRVFSSLKRQIEVSRISVWRRT